MEKEAHQDLFTTVTEQYSELELIENSALNPSEYELSRARTLRKYGLPATLNIVKLNTQNVESNGHSAAIRSKLYYEYATMLQKEADALGHSAQSNTLYEYAALLYMNSAIESQGISPDNAHAVVHCLAQIADLNEENRVDK